MLARQRFQTEANGGWEALRCLGPGVRWTFEESVFEVSRKKTRLMWLAPFWKQPHLASEAHHARGGERAVAKGLLGVLGGGGLRLSWLFSHPFFFRRGGVCVWLASSMTCSTHLLCYPLDDGDQGGSSGRRTFHPHPPPPSTPLLARDGPRGPISGVFFLRDLQNGL